MSVQPIVINKGLKFAKGIGKKFATNQIGKIVPNVLNDKKLEIYHQAFLKN